jgi:hypothetical protein
VSAKSGILKPGQPLTAIPYRRVKKAVALLLLRRLIVEEIIAGVLYRERPISQTADIPLVRLVGPAKPYIPEQMPPREVPNVFFKPPERKWNSALQYL